MFNGKRNIVYDRCVAIALSHPSQFNGRHTFPQKIYILSLSRMIIRSFFMRVRQAPTYRQRPLSKTKNAAFNKFCPLFEHLTEVP